MPDPGARDPHTQAFDQQGQHLVQQCKQGNYVGRLNTGAARSTS